MSKMSKAPIVIEKIWLVIAIITLLLFFYELYKKVELSQSYPLLIIFFVSLLMYFLRRYIRKNNKNASN